MYTIFMQLKNAYSKHALRGQELTFRKQKIGFEIFMVDSSITWEWGSVKCW